VQHVLGAHPTCLEVRHCVASEQKAVTGIAPGVDDCSVVYARQGQGCHQPQLEPLQHLSGPGRGSAAGILASFVHGYFEFVTMLDSRAERLAAGPKPCTYSPHLTDLRPKLSTAPIGRVADIDARFAVRERKPRRGADGWPCQKLPARMSATG
jgi:hypothetical protein